MSLPSHDRWQRLSPLLDELLDLAGAERARRLAAIAADDAALAAELAALLAQDAEARRGGFLAGSAAADPFANGSNGSNGSDASKAANGTGGRADSNGTAEGSGPAPHGPDAPDAATAGLVGLRIGAYALEAPLGQGGSGTVWRARRRDERVDHLAAVKLLHLSLVGHSAAERFRREGAILARLAHPGIATLVDSGVAPGGQPYLVLELVDGERIDRHCRRLRLDVDARLRLFLDVLDAVAHAHRHLVVHRDIKPSNVLVTVDGRVKLLDFGIAKLLDDDGAADATALTREGGRALTPEYAAPEQFLGTEVTTATDVYALGVLLYRLLAGRHPTQPSDGNAAQAARATLETGPSRLSRTLKPAHGAPADESQARIAEERASTPQRLRRRLAGDLETILDRMLRKAPAERYASVDAVAEDLRRHLDHLPIGIRPDGWFYRVGKFSRRHRGGVAAAGLVAVAIAAGIAGTVSQARRAFDQAAIAATERDRAREQLRRSEAADEFVDFLLSEGWTRQTSSTDLLRRAEHLIEVQFADDAALRARMLIRVADQYVDAGEGPRAIAVIGVAERAAREARDPVVAATVQCARAVASADALKSAEARRLYDEALAVLRPLAESEPGGLINCLIGRSHVDSLHDENPAAALAYADEALGRLGSPRPGQRGQQIAARNARASALGALQRIAEAADTYEALLADLSAMGRGQSRQAVIAWSSLAYLLDRAGQTRRGLDAITRAIDIDQGLHGSEQTSAVWLNNQSKYLQDVGEFEAAARASERALAKAAEDGNATMRAIVQLNYARHWCEAGDLGRCRALVAAAKRVLEPMFPPGHPRRANLALVDAFVARAAADWPAEHRALTTARQLQASAPGSHGAPADTLTALARVALRLGRVDESGAHAEAALAVARAGLAGYAHSRALGAAWAVRGEIDARRGDVEAARHAYAQAQENLDDVVGPKATLNRDVARALAALPAPETPSPIVSAAR